MDRNEILELMQKYSESGIYTGENVDGDSVIVMRQAGSGCTIKQLNSKGWYECVDYDEDGFRECDYVEPGPGIGT